MSDDYAGEPFDSRAVAPDVAAERGYRRYGGDLGLDPIFEAEPRYADTTPFRRRSDGKPDSLDAWVRRKTREGELTGWVMPKHALPGSAFYAPLAQLRPDKPVRGRLYEHDHAVDFASDEHRARHLEKKHPGRDVPGLHRHYEEAKYLIAPGPHGKRWDTHPRCTRDRFLAAERVFLHLEGTLKLDALVSAGEVGADVPSVTLWDRRPDELSEIDFPVRAEPPGTGFWEGLEERIAEEKARADLQAGELAAFLTDCVRAPVVVVCDQDWQGNPSVATEAFCLRDAVRDGGLDCVVAAPPTEKGSDDFQAAGGKPDDLLVVEPLPHRALGRADFERLYRRQHARGASGRRRPAEAVERDLELLDWYAAHATAAGFVQMSPKRIGRRLDGVSADTVRRATLRLKRADALTIAGYYDDPDERPERTAEEWRARGRRRRPAPATIRLRDGLAPEIWRPTVGRWLRAL